MSNVYWQPGVSLKKMEEMCIKATLKHFKGNKAQASDALGITVKTLYNKLQEYKISYNEGKVFVEDARKKAEEKMAALMHNPNKVSKLANLPKKQEFYPERVKLSDAEKRARYMPESPLPSGEANKKYDPDFDLTPEELKEALESESGITKKAFNNGAGLENEEDDQSSDTSSSDGGHEVRKVVAKRNRKAI